MKTRAFYYLALAALVAVTAAANLWHSPLAHSPAEQAALAAAAGRVESLPAAIGPWRVRSEERFSRRVVNMLECAGHVNRSYVHEETGEVVSLAVFVGPAGPLVAHSPEVCVSAREFEVLKSSQSRVVRDWSAGADQLAAIDFRARTAAAELLRVYYGWHPGTGGWQAPEQPRMTLGGTPVLYKLQVSALLRPSLDSETNDSCLSFLSELLPELDRALFAKEASTP